MTGSNANGVAGRGLNIRYGGNGYMRLQGNGGGTGDHTLTLGGDFYFAPDTTNIGFIGSTTAGSALNVNLGGTTRTFSGLSSSRQFQLVNTISNGGIAASSLKLQLAGANTYAGGTAVNAGGTVQTMATGNLGTGDVTLANLNTVFLTLGNGTSIADTASIYFGNESTITLNNAGTETVASLINQTQSLAMTAGEWDASELNSFFGGDVFAGSGKLFVIPEPSSLLLGLTGLAFACLTRRRR